MWYSGRVCYVCCGAAAVTAGSSEKTSGWARSLRSPNETGLRDPLDEDGTAHPFVVLPSVGRLRPSLGHAPMARPQSAPSHRGAPRAQTAITLSPHAVARGESSPNSPRRTAFFFRGDLSLQSLSTPDSARSRRARADHSILSPIKPHPNAETRIVVHDNRPQSAPDTRRAAPMSRRTPRPDRQRVCPQRFEPAKC